MSRLGCCNAVKQRGVCVCVSHKLLVQNAVALVQMGVCRLEHIIPILLDLHWTLISFCAQDKVLLHFYNPLYGLEAKSLMDRIFRYHPIHAQSSTEETFLAVLLAKQVCAKEGRAFSVIAPHLLWECPSRSGSDIIMSGQDVSI